ncbi:MAG: hypothetical protein ACQESB_01775, partial [Elusimicrobiota bacterium]
MLFSLKMAWAYFKRVWGRGIWGVMVIIAVTGVMLGVASLVVSLSVMNGFHTEITSRLLSFNPHIIITTPARGVDSREQVSNVLDNLDLVEGFSPFIYGKG